MGPQQYNVMGPGAYGPGMQEPGLRSGAMRGYGRGMAGVSATPEQLDQQLQSIKATLQIRPGQDEAWNQYAGVMKGQADARREFLQNR